MNHQFVFHDFSRIPSIFCSLFCSMFSARALPSSRMQKPSKQGACAPQSPSCLPKEQGMHLTSLPFPSVLVGYGDRQKRARSKLSWKTAFFQSRHSVKDSMSKSWAIGPLLSYHLECILHRLRPLRKKKKATAFETSWQLPHCGLVSAINSLL